MRVLDAFPGGAARDGDFLSGSSSPTREFQPIHQDQWGTAYRPERVLATGVVLGDYELREGEVCFLESTIQGMGQLMGLVPQERLDIAHVALMESYARIEDLEAQLAQLTVVDAVVEQAVAKALADLAPQLVGLVDDATKATEATDAPKAAPPPSDKELAAARRRK